MLDWLSLLKLNPRTKRREPDTDGKTGRTCHMCLLSILTGPFRKNSSDIHKQDVEKNRLSVLGRLYSVRLE